MFPKDFTFIGLLLLLGPIVPSLATIPVPVPVPAPVPVHVPVPYVEVTDPPTTPPTAPQLSETIPPTPDSPATSQPTLTNIIAYPQIHGVVWKDIDNDGNAEEYEIKYFDVTISLTPADDTLNDVSLQTTTDEYGHFFFPNLTQESYYVEITDLNSVIDSQYELTTGESPLLLNLTRTLETNGARSFEEVKFGYNLPANFDLGETCLSDEFLLGLGINPPKNVGPKVIIEMQVSSTIMHVLDSTVATILLKDVMGFDVEVYQTSGTGQGASILNLAEGIVDINVEVWEDDISVYDKYVVREESVLDQGPLGVVVQLSWFAPTYTMEFVRGQSLQDDSGCPITIESWEAFQKPNIVAIFKNQTPDAIQDIEARHESAGDIFIPPQCQPNPSDCMSFKASYKTWFRGITEAQIVNLELNMTILYLGEDFQDVLKTYFAEKKNVLFYNWIPSEFTLRYPCTRVALKSYSVRCWENFSPSDDGSGSAVDCESLPIPIAKLTSLAISNTPSLAPVKNFVDLYKLTNTDIDTLFIDAWRLSQNVSACLWVRNNANSWKHWVVSQKDECDAGEEMRISKEGAQLCVVCPQRTYNLEQGGNCTECPGGALCDGGSHLAATEDFWRGNDNEFYKCKPGACCPSGSCALGSKGVCAEGRTGILCGKCVQGASEWGDQCVTCEGSHGGLVFMVLVLGFFLNLALIWFVKKMGEEKKDNKTGGKTGKTRGSTWLFQIMVDYFQMASLVVNRNRLGSLLSIINVDFEWLFTVGGAQQVCVFPVSPLAKSFMPFFMSLLLFGELGFLYSLWLAWRSWHGHPVKQPLFVMASLRLFLLTYVGVCVSFLSMFNCRKVDNVYVMVSAHGVRCFQGAHIVAITFSAILLALMLLLVAVALRKYVARITSAQDKREGENRKGTSFHETERKYGVLYLAYTPQARNWYQPWFLVRRTVLSVVYVFCSDSGSQHLAVMIVVVFIWMVHIITKPFVKWVANITQSLLFGSVLVVGLFSESFPMRDVYSGLILLIFLLPWLTLLGFKLVNCFCPRHDQVEKKIKSMLKDEIHPPTEVQGVEMESIPEGRPRDQKQSYNVHTFQI